MALVWSLFHFQHRNGTNIKNTRLMGSAWRDRHDATGSKQSGNESVKSFSFQHQPGERWARQPRRDAHTHSTTFTFSASIYLWKKINKSKTKQVIHFLARYIAMATLSCRLNLLQIRDQQVYTLPSDQSNQRSCSQCASLTLRFYCLVLFFCSFLTRHQHTAHTNVRPSSAYVNAPQLNTRDTLNVQY